MDARAKIIMVVTVFIVLLLTPIVFNSAWAVVCPPAYPVACPFLEGLGLCCQGILDCFDPGEVDSICTIECPTEKIYGEHSEETELLRYLRDNVLSQTPEGQEIIKLYYELSPVIVEMMEEDEAFKSQVKERIDGVVELIGKVE